jgi:hypothetical protein
MSLLRSTPLHTPVQDSHLMSFFSGRKPNIPGILQKEPPEIRYDYNSYVQELQSRLQSCYDVARSNLKAKKEKSKEYYDRNTNVPLFAVGEKVLLHDEKLRGRSAKLSQPYIGLYEITSIDGVNITLKLPRNKTLKVHANKLKPFFDELQDCKLWYACVFDSHSFGCHCAAV